MNVPDYPFFVYLPATPPSPPPYPAIESPPMSPKELDPVLDTPQEIEKWVLARKKNFPSQKRIEELKEGDVAKVERGDLSKLEVRMRKRMALMRKFFKRIEEKPGRNPFLKYMNLRKRLTNNTLLKEQRLILQCIRFVVSNRFLSNDEKE